MKPLRRKCIPCNQWFNPIRDNQYVCSYECSCVKNNEKFEKQKASVKKKSWTKEKAKITEDLMTQSEWIQKLQKVFNEFIRERDKGLPCISCKGTRDVEYAAGHFIPTTYQYLRFNEDNVNRQCNQYCNMHLRGNLAEYRPNLIKKIGIRRVEQLEADRHKTLHLSIPEIKELIAEYKYKTKDIKTHDT